MNDVPILYENEGVLAADKPEGLVSNARGEGGLFSHLGPDRAERLYIIHRLDKEVSGVLVLAMYTEAHKFLNDAFSRGNVDKTYRAAALGAVDKPTGVIDRPIREFGSGRMGVDPA